MDGQTSTTAFDPIRESALGRITIVGHADGGKEFILPALRNFREKISFALIWLFMTVAFVGISFANATIAKEVPGWLGFLILNHTLYFLAIIGLFVFVLTIACLDIWLRSSRVIANKSELRVITHWLFLKRTNVVSITKIIETRAENRTTVNTTLYFDILVLATGDGPGWIARNFPARTKPESSFTENDIKVFNTGGKKIAIATGIEGKEEADWILSQLREAMGISV